MRENNDKNSKTYITTTTFEFTIWNLRGEDPMKDITLSSLPSFQGMTMEDLDKFWFEFDVLCRMYDYAIDAQNLKLFSTTLKVTALRWFMGLSPTSISMWNAMKETFLSNYQDYCRTRDIGEEIFRMTQKEKEILEDYVEWFHYNLQRSKHIDLDSEILKTIFIRGMRADYLDTLNLLGKGDISQEPFAQIVKLFLRCS